MLKTIIIHTYLLLSLSFTIDAQEVLTLPKAIAIALDNNYGIQIAEKNIEIADNNNTWARAGRTPVIDLNGSFNNTLINDNNPASFLRGTYYSGGLSATANASYQLYAGGRIRILKDQLNIQTDLQRLAKDEAIHNLIRSIYQSYNNVVLQQEQLGVLAQVLALSADRLSYEEAKRDYGSSNSYNLIQFSNAIASDSTNFINQSLQVDNAMRSLVTLMQVDNTTDYVIDEKLNVSQESLDIDKLRTTLLDGNYTLRNLDIIANLNRLNTKLSRAAQLPSVNLFGSLGYAQNGFQFFADDPNTGDPFPFFFSNRLTTAAGIQATWNLYDGGVRSTDRQNAIVQEAIDELSIQDAELSIENQLITLAENYSTQINILQLTQRQINLSQQNLDISQEQFKAGRISSLDYRNSQIQYLNAALTRAAAIYNLIISKSEIDYLVGQYDQQLN